MFPLAITPMELIFRRMIAVSVVLHVAVLGICALWAGFHSPPARFLSVTVVDLVGGEAFAPPPRERAKPAEPAPPAPTKSATEEKTPAPSPPVTAMAEKKSRAEEKPNAMALAESIKKMREKKESAEHVQQAVRTIRRRNNFV